MNFYFSLLRLICGVRISCVSCFGMCLRSLEGNECVSVLLRYFCHKLTVCVFSSVMILRNLEGVRSFVKKEEERRKEA